MKSVSVKEMKRLDALTIRHFAIPASVLMENAGRSAAEEALKMLPKAGPRRVAVFCGYGNNGGDGFVLARHLLNKGVRVQIYLVGKNKKMSQEAKLNYLILRKMEQKFKLLNSADAFNELKQGIKKFHLIVDGIFGIGLKGELDNFYQELFNALNAAGLPILALDIPSGLDADTGMPLGDAIRAKRTVAFGLLKRGLIQEHARKFTGKIIVGDISLPRIK